MNGNGPTTLYRFYDADDRLLYVGITNETGRRFKQHSVSQVWWAEVTTTSTEEFATRLEAATAERAAIAAERPVHNIVGTSRRVRPHHPRPGPDPDSWRHRSGAIAGRAIRRERQTTGWSQAELARRCGLSSSAVAGFEGGQRPGAKALNAMFPVLHCTSELAWLLGFMPELGRVSPELAIELDDSIPEPHKRTLLACLAEVRRIAARQDQ